jgi:hypothetical protein
MSFKKKCDRRHPPGRKVYQRGAHTIWEVDGAREKVSQVDNQRSLLCCPYVFHTALLSKFVALREALHRCQDIIL